MTWLVYQYGNLGCLRWSCDFGVMDAYEHLASFITEFDLPDDGTWFCEAGHR